MTATTKKDTPRPVAIELFCGAGGMALGFEQAGFDVLAAVDHDPIHLAVHSFNFPFTTPICADVSAVTPETIAGSARKGWGALGRQGEWNGEIDCLFGGPSCQGFSYIGKGDTKDSRNDLVRSFATLVAELQPKTFVLENVPGLLSPKYSGRLQELLDRLSNAGYALVAGRPLLLDAADYGVPQARRRVFLVGAQQHLALPPLPVASAAGVTSLDALKGLPNADDWMYLLSQDVLRLTDVALAAMEKSSSEYGKSLRTPFANEYPRVWSRNELAGCLRTVHTDEVRSRFAALPPGGEDGPSRFRRLARSGTSFTLRAGTGRDHGSFTAPRPIHYRYPRVLTVREAARLHSLPDWYRLHVTKWHGHRQIGNAVPPRLAYAVATSILDALDCGSLSPPTDARSLGDESLLALTLTEAAAHFDYDQALLPYDVRRRTNKPRRLKDPGDISFKGDA
jgi:DNA (cytosine-5)-methyltransferase 1